MSKQEIRMFLSQGTLTGKMATVNNDGSSDVVPIWFILDTHDLKYNVVLTTNIGSKKARNIQHDNRISIVLTIKLHHFRL